MSGEFDYNQRAKVIDLLANNENLALEDELIINIKFSDASQKKVYQKAKKFFVSIEKLESI